MTIILVKILWSLLTLQFNMFIITYHERKYFYPNCAWRVLCYFICMEDPCIMYPFETLLFDWYFISFSFIVYPLGWMKWTHENPSEGCLERVKLQTGNHHWPDKIWKIWSCQSASSPEEQGSFSGAVFDFYARCFPVSCQSCPNTSISFQLGVGNSHCQAQMRGWEWAWSCCSY